MNPEDGAKFIFDIISKDIASKEAAQYFQVAIAHYPTEHDFDAFMPEQNWRWYQEAAKYLRALCEGKGWQFADGVSVTRDSFEEYAGPNGLSGQLSEKLDYVITVLGHTIHSNRYRKAFGLSPVVVFSGSSPTFLPRLTTTSAYVIEN
jgi:hypothetical protein